MENVVYWYKKNEGQGISMTSLIEKERGEKCGMYLCA